MLGIIILFHQSVNIFFTQDDFHLIPVSNNGFLSNVAQNGLGDGFFRPITRNIYFSLAKKLFGLNFHCYHAFSIFLHFLNSILVFLILFQLTGNNFLSFFVSCFYSIHDSHYFSLFWVSGIQELGLSFFILASFYFYLRYRHADRFQDYLFSIFFFIAALFSKETAMVFPAVLLSYDILYRKGKKLNLKLLLPHVFLILVFLVLKHGVLKYSFALKGEYYSQGLGIHAISNFIYFALRSVTFLIPLKIFLNAGNEDFSIFLREMINIYLIPVILLIGLILALILFTIRKYRKNATVKPSDWLKIRDVKKLLFFSLSWFVFFLTPVLFFKKSHSSYYLSLPIIGYVSILGVIVFFIYSYLLQKKLRIVSIIFLTFAFVLPFVMTWKIFQSNLTSESWDTPIPNKNIFAERCVTSLKRKYATFPARSTLYFLGFTKDQQWATGYGRMFKFFFSDKIRIEFVDKKTIPIVLKTHQEKVFFFRYDGKGLREVKRDRMFKTNY